MPLELTALEGQALRFLPPKGEAASIDSLARRLGLEPLEVVDLMINLTTHQYVQHSGQGYAITERGRQWRQANPS